MQQICQLLQRPTHKKQFLNSGREYLQQWKRGKIFLYSEFSLRLQKKKVLALRGKFLPSLKFLAAAVIGMTRGTSLCLHPLDAGESKGKWVTQGWIRGFYYCCFICGSEICYCIWKCWPAQLYNHHAAASKICSRGRSVL